MISRIKGMMALLRSELTGAEIDRSLFAQVSEEDWRFLYEFSDYHDLAHLVGDALIKNRLIPEGEIKLKFKKKLMTAVYRYQNIQHEYETIKTVLLEEKIPFIPLKGIVLWSMYPEPWMRTCGDIDLLIHEENLSNVMDLLDKKGYKKFGQTMHDVSYVLDSKIHLEIHHSLIEAGRIGQAEQLLVTVWEHASQIGTSSEYALDDPMFYYYHLAHMAKHLEGGGGCGIRSFLDLWLLDHAASANQQGRDDLLIEGGLDRFEVAAQRVLADWFEGKEPSPLTRQLESYVLSGGVYGNTKNFTLIGTGKTKNRISYLLKRCWVPYEQLAADYPSLKGKRILQPLYEARRLSRIFQRDTFARGKTEIKTTLSVTGKKRKEITQMLSDLGLI